MSLSPPGSDAAAPAGTAIGAVGPDGIAVDERYCEAEVRAIGAHFAPTEAEHSELRRQVAALGAIGKEVHAALRTTAWLDRLLQYTRADRPALDAIHAVAHAAHNSHCTLLAELGKFTQVLLARIPLERMHVYAQLSKVPPPLPQSPAADDTAPPERCDARCELGISTKQGGGTPARQLCCGAYVCTTCLYFYNFQQSAQATLLYAPCFHCGKLRGIFKRNIDRQ